MTTTIIGVYIVTLAAGAIIVAITAFRIIKSTRKKGTAQTQKQLVKDTETPTALRKRHAPTLGLTFNRLSFLLRRALGKFSRQKHNALPDRQPVDEGLAINEQFSIPSPGVVSSEPETNTAPFSPNQGVPNPEPENEGVPEANMINTSPADLVQEAPNPEPENEGAPEADMINNPPAESDEITQGWPQEETKELSEATDNEYQEQPTNKDAMLDLFAAEIAEENDVSKLAATLNNIDAQDLLEEAQSFINQLSGGLGR